MTKSAKQKMGKNNRARGFQFERDVVNQARAKGLTAERMWGSDGQTRGLPSNVDIVMEDNWYQCKRKKKIADYVKPDAGIFAQVIRQDRDESLVVIRLNDYLGLLKQAFIPWE